MKGMFVLLGWLCSLVLGSVIVVLFGKGGGPDELLISVAFMVVGFLASLPALVITYVTALLVKFSSRYFWYVQIAHVACTVITYLVLDRQAGFMLNKSVMISIYFAIGFTGQYLFHYRWLKKRKTASENDPLDDLDLNGF